ncbi:S-adenosyl-L-methionine-dependent methyltransferase [Talaromyces proteolyticus]|uniref:S-adenosyl-L-methionine-dependent methyltransferase n=1 Tax=Talaromyces proteolyticus TaxID=1131652 RepID=A0AAD4KTI7_9EURO|nr:S-adenosyl-L-methionine-dependent methyltransferase [Talaromyces proteolyticus]KAH8696251.1 S-adenosyl-L-methionine-dependent methyltransferase [Talaromyces proteolyticus]
MASNNAPENSLEQSLQVRDDEFIEASEVDADAPESAYGDENESYTTSLMSSVRNYRYENGRRYHAFRDEVYFLPNDEMESERLDLFHEILTRRCDGELHLAPIGTNPQRILDLGTGTGIWAVDIGDKFPSAEVLGNDLSPIQPSLVPPNVRFEVDDMENEWLYGSKFDFIHARYLAGAIKDWPRLMDQAFKFTKPGGWVEFQDFDMKFYSTQGEFSPGCPMDEWTKLVVKGLKKIGVEPEPGPKLEGWLKDAGFTNVHEKVLPIPVGVWPKNKQLKEIGALDYHQFLEGLEGISLHLFTNTAGWKPEEVQVFLVNVRKDLKNPRFQAQHNLHVVYAQKPLDAE